MIDLRGNVALPRLRRIADKPYEEERDRSSPDDIDAAWVWHYSLTAIEALRELRDHIPEEKGADLQIAHDIVYECFEWARTRMTQFKQTP